MFVTNSNDRLLSPGYDRQNVVLYGQNVETAELIVRAGHPVFVKNEDTLKVWYKADLLGTSELPGDEVCFDIYGYGRLLIYFFSIVDWMYSLEIAYRKR